MVLSSVRMDRRSGFIWTVLSAALLWAQAQAAQMKVDETFCGPRDFFSSANNGFTIVTNIWNPTEHGAQCMTVTDKGSRFEVTWLWETSRATVHSFPHIKFNSKMLPIALGDMSALRLAGSWSFVPGDVAAREPVFDAEGLIQNSVTANVAIDMFADEDIEKAKNETLAKYEILIWLGTIGQPYPLGWNESTWDYTLDGAEYTLYRGTNQRGITSFTWFPPQNTTTFDTDFYPLVKFLIDNQLIEPTVQLGLVAFGQEAFFSTGNVTFAAEGYNINITRPDGESATVGSDNPSGKGAAGGLRPASFGALVGVVAVLCAFL